MGPQGRRERSLIARLRIGAGLNREGLGGGRREEKSDKKNPCSGSLKLETQREPLAPKNGRSESEQGIQRLTLLLPSLTSNMCVLCLFWFYYTVLNEPQQNAPEKKKLETKFHENINSGFIEVE